MIKKQEKQQFPAICQQIQGFSTQMCSHLERSGLKGSPSIVTTILFFASSHISVNWAHQNATQELLSMPGYDDKYQISAKGSLRPKAKVANAWALKSVSISEYAEYMTNALLLTT